MVTIELQLSCISSDYDNERYITNINQKGVNLCVESLASLA